MIARSHCALGDALQRADRNAEAIGILRDGIAWWRKLRQHDDNHLKDLITSLYNLGELLALAGEDQQARDAYTEALRHNQEREAASSCTCDHFAMGHVVTLLRRRTRDDASTIDQFLDDGTIPLDRLFFAP